MGLHQNAAALSLPLHGPAVNAYLQAVQFIAEGGVAKLDLKTVYLAGNIV